MDKIRGAGWIVLNILRGCNIITLLTICVSAWIMIVTGGLPNAFFFFDAASHFFFSCTAIFLVISETGVFSSYFEHNWPVLSYSHSFIWLGITMLIMGCSTLGALAHPARSQERLGLPMWRAIIASGLLALIFGFINLVVSLIWRDSQNGITARHVRNDGSLAKGMVGSAEGKGFSDTSSSVRSNSLRSRDGGYTSPTARAAPGNRITRLFGRVAGGVSGGAAGLKISKPIPNADLEAAYHSREPQPVVDDDDRRSPVVPELKRPPTAMHPAFTGGSRYSEVSHLNRF